MPKKRSWSDEELVIAVVRSKSIRAVLIELRLVPAWGNYSQIYKAIKTLSIDTAHFTGQGWNKHGRATRLAKPLDDVLVSDSDTQSHKLKLRLFAEGIKQPCCELCGWAATSVDGRVPVELDHINGDHRDNRLLNLRILCPNCHSLQPTHRGRNKKIGFARMS